MQEIFRSYGFDKTLFLVVLIMLSFGLVMVYSSSAYMASEKYENSFYFLIHQFLGVGLGMFVIIVMMSVKRPFYQHPTFIYGLLLISFLLLSLTLFMPAVMNTNRWIVFFGLRFQPSELAKLSLTLYLAFYLDRKKDTIQEFQTLLPPLAVLGTMTLLILKEPDYSTALLVTIISAIMLFIGGVRARHFLGLAVAAGGLFIFILFQKSYWMNRILAFLDPEKDPTGNGFQILQSQIAVGSGGLFGVSIGESTQKLFYLPCAHTDYIYAIIGEELGFIGALAVLLLLVLFLWRGLTISWKAPDLFSQILAAGLTLSIFTQGLLNITIVLGLGPPTGLPLPLISYGRSSLLMTLFSIAILLHISQRRQRRSRGR